MRWGFAAIPVLGLLLISACEGDKDQYSGLSDLVAERQEVRESISKKTARQKDLEKIWSENEAGPGEKTGTGKKSISTTIMYEKPIEILDSESKMPLAKGVAYMNKSGQIVKIKVFRN